MGFGAFNDNFYKNALIILITYQLAGQLHQDAALLINIASACFIVPFFLFSGIAGMWADKLRKHRLARILKVIELLLYLAAGAAILSQHLWAMMVVLFALGTLAAFFGPVKYAILPELVTREELLFATGIVEGGTYIMILFGTLLGTLLVLKENGLWMVAGVIALFGVLGVVTAWMIPPTRQAQPHLRVDYHIVRGIRDMVRVAFSNSRILTAILGISWFWAIGGTYTAQLAVYAKNVVGADETVVSLYMGTFIVGIAVGSFVCSQVVKRAKPGIVPPVALAVVMLCGIDLCLTGYRLPVPSGALIALSDYFTDFSHYHILLDLVVMSFSGGLFVVPLYTSLQVDSSEAERARTIASNNVLNALFITTGALLAAGLYAAHLHVVDVLLIFALLNIPIILRLWLKRAG